MYLLLSTFPSSLIKGPKESHVKQPQTITPPPPCLTVGTTQSMSYLSFRSLHMGFAIIYKQSKVRFISPYYFFPIIFSPFLMFLTHCIRSFLVFSEIIISGFRAATWLL